MALIVDGTTVTTGSNLDATTLSGNLPEISGADLTNLPAPSAANVGTATASLSVGDVGSYAFGSKNTNGTTNSNSNSHVSPGSTVSGSQMIYSNAHSNRHSAHGSGTWRCMGYGFQRAMHTKATVYLRIS